MTNTYGMRLFVCGIAGIAAAAAFAMGPASFELDWFTIDGGGAMRSTGGHFELNGTIGQMDAGTPLTGGHFELTGGFWFGLVPDDCNSDGGIDLCDYFDLKACLGGPNGDPGAESCTCFDQDRDRDVDLVDFADFQTFFHRP